MAPKRRKTKAKAKKGTRKTAARKTKTAPRRRKLSKKQAARRARAARRVTGKHTRRAKAIVRSKGKRRSTKKAIARTYLRGRSIAMRAKKGRLSKENTELARAMGLTRINPSMKAIGKDALVMLSRFGAAGAGVVSGVVVGLKVGTWLQAKLAASPVPGIIKNNMVPITTLGLGAAVWTVMKLGKRTQSWAMPVGLGFGAAGFVFMLTHTVMGRSMLAKAGIQIDVKAIAGNVATVADGTNAGLGSYVAGLGEYVQAGQGALEGYVTGDGEELQLAGHQGIFAGLGDAPDFYEASDDETYEIGEVGIFSGGSSI